MIFSPKTLMEFLKGKTMRKLEVKHWDDEEKFTEEEIKAKEDTQKSDDWDMNNHHQQ